MTETKLKALMHNGRFVNAASLMYGIHYTEKPKFYSYDATMKDLAKEGQEIKSFISNAQIYNAYFENLAQCELVTVRVIVENESPETK